MLQILKPSSLRLGGYSLLLVTAAITALSGCVANSSNPRVNAGSATIDNQAAQVDLNLVNPGGRHLTVLSIDYELSHGEMGFPVAAGTWEGNLDLPAQSEARLPLTISFDTEPIETDSNLLHMIGTLRFKDHTGFLGMPSMNLTQTSFQIEIEAEQHQ